MKTVKANKTLIIVGVELTINKIKVVTIQKVYINYYNS